MVDVLRIEMELEELQNQLAYLKDSKTPLTTQFEQLLNTNLVQDITFPEVLWEENLSVSKELIMDSVTTMNPAILSLNHELLSYDQDVIAAKKAGGPSFTVGLNYTFVGQRDGYTGTDNGKDAFLPTIGVKIPLYRKNYTAIIKEKEIARESVALRKVDKTNTLKTGLDRGFRDYDAAVRRIALYIQLGDHARQAMDLLIAEFTAANTNFEEIIRMDRKLLKYKLELEKARADQNTAVAYLNYLMGK
jgi:outer membrane protein TolC